MAGLAGPNQFVEYWLYRAGLNRLVPFCEYHHQISGFPRAIARRGYFQRSGRALPQRPAGEIVWLHCDDLDSSQGFAGLIARFLQKRPEAHILVTTLRSPSMRDIANLPPRTICQIIPADRPDFARNFVQHWRPAVALFMGNALRPDMTHMLHRHHIPYALIDGYMENAHYHRLRWLPGLSSRILGNMSFILARSDDDARRLRRMGAPADRMKIVGELSEPPPPPAADPNRLAQLSDIIAARPVWTVLGSHLLEENAIATAHNIAKKAAHNLLLILMPDDPARSEKLADAFEKAGEKVARYAKGERPQDISSVLIIDDPAELGLWLRLSSVCFIGGSMQGAVYHDPRLAILLGSAVICGNEAPLSDQLQAFAEQGAIRRIATAQELGLTIKQLLNSDEAAQQTQLAWEKLSANARTTDQTIKAILAVLEKKGLQDAA